MKSLLKAYDEKRMRVVRVSLQTVRSWPDRYFILSEDEGPKNRKPQLEGV